MPVKIDNDFDQSTHIANLTVNNVATIPFEEMLAILTPFVLVQVPEDTTSVDEKRRLDYLLARCANLRAYLLTLWSVVTYQRAKLKKADAETAEEMQKKKEVLYELAGAMKLKYEACSRKITLLLENEDDDTPDRVDYNARRSARDERQTATARPAEPSAAPPRASAHGGWGTVG